MPGFTIAPEKAAARMKAACQPSLTQQADLYVEAKLACCMCIQMTLLQLSWPHHMTAA